MPERGAAAAVGAAGSFGPEAAHEGRGALPDADQRQVAVPRLVCHPRRRGDQRLPVQGHAEKVRQTSSRSY